MSRFKRCEVDGCAATISRINSIVIRLRTSDEGFGHFHDMESGAKCSVCGLVHIIKPEVIKLKVCKNCYNDYKNGEIHEIIVNRIKRKIDSFDEKNNVAYYSKIDE